MEIKQVDQTFVLYDNHQEIGKLTFVPHNEQVIDANHTFIIPEYRGQDLGLRLVEALTDYARHEHLQVLPSCPYVAKVFSAEEHYHDIWYQGE
ncbi:GNAT family N-acetyltransferase [Vagococcus zengguangii]|uniref:N-acetyltransferase n=1 Tax=Vagococcus zengguangii TaxID=2571750 RepID=A0A4D7CVG1_9ENTE|nr:GNAT family N-acetyltransferase [Vagococcus zengguangii]QCI87212.1 N-acetyltransferase [Vagococcus zengguangii]TLG80716.1 N-acetyltransferase [Vagococcus zengguangii]